MGTQGRQITLADARKFVVRVLFGNLLIKIMRNARIMHDGTWTCRRRGKCIGIPTYFHSLAQAWAIPEQFTDKFDFNFTHLAVAKIVSDTMIMQCDLRFAAAEVKSVLDFSILSRLGTGLGPNLATLRMKSILNHIIISDCKIIREMTIMQRWIATFTTFGEQMYWKSHILLPWRTTYAKTRTLC